MAEARRLPSTLRAWWLLEKAAFRAQGQYRGNLFAAFIGGLTYQGIQIAFIAILLSSFGLIDGWGMRDIGLLIGIRLCAHAGYVIPFGSLLRTNRLIHEGEFDLILLRPVNRFVQVITREVLIMSVGDGVLGLTVLIGFGVAAPVDWTWVKICYVILAVAGGALVETAIQVMITSFAFRATNVHSLQTMADSVVTTFGVYPLTIFGKTGLIALCFAFPLGFIAYLPAAALLGRAAEVPLPPAIVWGAPAAGWILFPLALWFFGRMSRHYVSPGA